MGRNIKVELSQGKKEKPAQRTQDNRDRPAKPIIPVSADSTTVFVGNISFNASKEEIEEVFSQIEGFKEVRIITDRDTGRPKGYGYAEFEGPEGVKEALGLSA